MFIQCANKLNLELKLEVPRVVITGILGLIMGIIGMVKATYYKMRAGVAQKSSPLQKLHLDLTR
jgi:hypothetical protein